MKVVYTKSIYGSDDAILCSFWLLASNESLMLWSSLPHTLFKSKLDELMDKPLEWNDVERALNIMYTIIDWVDENNYHHQFAFHPSVTHSDKESFYFSVHYRGITNHPNIIFCCETINNYDFIRYQQDYESQMICSPEKFEAIAENTTREGLEIFLQNAPFKAKEWYTNNYNVLSAFRLKLDEMLTSIYGFDCDGQLVCVLFNKGSWME